MLERCFLAVSMPLLFHLLASLDHRHRPDPLSRQLTEIGRWLAASYDPDTTLLQPAIGILGWESGLRIVDHAGLVTPGLYFFDDDHCTPLREVIERHRPDLILYHADVEPDLGTLGYRPLRRFDGALSYFLLARTDDQL